MHAVSENSEQGVPSAASPRRILFLSPFFFPEPISTGRYNTYLVQRLIEMGAKIDVVSSYPLYPAWRPDRNAIGFSGSQIHRAGGRVRYPSSTIGRRLVLETWFGLYALLWAVRLRKDVDTVISITPPGFYLPVLRKILPKTVRIVCVVHDLQGIMAESTQNRIRRVVAKAVSGIERRALAACDKVICLSQSMQRIVTERYGVGNEKCEVHYPFPTMSARTKGQNNLEAFFPGGFLHVVYAGALGEKQRPRELFTFFERLCQKRKDVMCHIFSAGRRFEALQQEAQKRRIDRLFVRDLVSDDDLVELYERSTVQVIPQAEDTGVGAFPSKLPNLLQAAVPIFAICDEDSELAKVLRESQSGISVSGRDIDVWVERMGEFLDRIEHSASAEVQQMTREYLARNFSLDPLVASILQR